MILRRYLAVVLLTGLLLATGAFLPACSSPSAQAVSSDPHDGHDHGENEQVEDEHAEDEHAEDEHAEEPLHRDEDEDAHAGHDHEDEDLVVLTDEERARVVLKTEEAEKRPLSFELTLPAEVRLDEDRVAHVVPRLPGIAVEVRGRVGAKVRKGEVLAVLESRELADVQAELLAAASSLGLAEKMHAREKGLWEKKISAENDYLEAQRDLEESRIAVRAARQKLAALGISADAAGGASMTRYEVRAPFDGEIIEKHITLGEHVEGDSEVFVVADLRTVWVDVNVFQNDLPRLAEGQKVVLNGAPGMAAAKGVLSYVGPMIDRETRTALARIVLPNEGGAWRPGLFVNVQLTFDGQDDVLTVPVGAVQRIGEQQVVFVEDGDAFAIRHVTVGAQPAVTPGNAGFVEVVSGLAPGEKVVSSGAFELKAKLVTSGMGSHAGHGH